MRDIPSNDPAQTADRRSLDEGALRSELAAMRAELAAVRAESRSSRRIAGLSACALVAALFGGLIAMENAEVARVIQTRRLEIIDEAGRVALVATSTAQGGRVDLWNAAGANVARVGSNDVGGDFILWNGEGRAAFSAYAQASGGRAELGTSAGKLAGVIEASPAGGRLTLANAAGNSVVGAGAFEAGGAIRLGDRENNDAAVLQATATGGSLGLQAPDGALVARLRGVETGGELDLASRSGKQRIAASALEAEAAITASTDAGSSRLEAGRAGGAVEVRNPDGDRIVSLEPAEGAGIVLCRARGERVLASIGATPTAVQGSDRGGLVQVFNASQQPVFAATANGDGAGRLALGTAAGSATLVAESGRDDGASMSFARAGKRSIAFLAGPNGGLLNLFSATGVPLVVAGAADDAQGGLVVVRSSEGKDLLRAGVDDKGSGNVILFNKDASERKSVAGPR